MFYPSLQEIESNTLEHKEPGELHLLRILQGLPDVFEVYFQPHIKYAHPDIVILKPGSGALIIEVKDWNLSSYTYNPEDKGHGYMTIGDSETKWQTPMGQANGYKDDLYDVLCPALHRQMLQRNSRDAYGIVRTAVYFYQQSAKAVYSVFNDKEKWKYSGVCPQFDWAFCWTQEDDEDIVGYVCRIMTTKSECTPVIDKELHVLFKPSEHWAERFIPVELDKKQEALTRVECRPRKLRGPAGTGKSLILAKKAVNCFMEKQQPVLILTYNITLRNYLHDVIAMYTRSLKQRDREGMFKILHFDSLLPELIEDLGLVGPAKPKDFKDEELMEAYRQAQMDILRANADRLPKYSSVLIDEAQDYKNDWLRFINKYLVPVDADYFAVADEVQNVYGHALLETRTRLPTMSGFPGAWNQVVIHYRSRKDLSDLCAEFQREYLEGKYDPLYGSGNRCWILDGEMAYSFRHERRIDDIARSVYAYVERKRKEGNGISPNDICIMALEQSIVSEIDSVYRSYIGDNATTMTSYIKEDKELAIKNGYKKKDLDTYLYEQTRAHKWMFRLNTGSIKVSTVHSMKGWEMDTVFFVLTNESQMERYMNEIVYTAITRAKRNLFILNYGCKKYNEFFDDHINKGITYY